MKNSAFTRRDFLRAGLAGGAGLAGLTLLSRAQLTQAQAPHPDHAAQADVPPIGHGAHAATPR